MEYWVDAGSVCLVLVWPALEIESRSISFSAGLSGGVASLLRDKRYQHSGP